MSLIASGLCGTCTASVFPGLSRFCVAVTGAPAGQIWRTVHASEVEALNPLADEKETGKSVSFAFIVIAQSPPPVPAQT